jgi:hypothetical protein
VTERAWTVEEANAALGWVAGLVERAQALRAEGRELTEGAPGRARTNGHGLHVRASRELAKVVAELAEAGVVLRDVERGLVDFPAKSPTGRPYLLCWLVGEPEVAWWHWPDAGFAGRTPLADPPA